MDDLWKFVDLNVDNSSWFFFTIKLFVFAYKYVYCHQMMTFQNIPYAVNNKYITRKRKDRKYYWMPAHWFHLFSSYYEMFKVQFRRRIEQYLLKSKLLTHNQSLGLAPVLGKETIFFLILNHVYSSGSVCKEFYSNVLQQQRKRMIWMKILNFNASFYCAISFDCNAPIQNLT